MIYRELAEIYDQLVKDEEATKSWVKFVTDNISGNKILELACGSGEISLALAELGYEIFATDNSEAMLEKARGKIKNQKIEFANMNMLSWTITDKYDGIICFCDSLNYMCEYEELRYIFHQANKHLNAQGVLLFDIHHQHRLVELNDGWDEEGSFGDISYQWIIQRDYNQLIHYFNFIKENHIYQEIHVQTVFNKTKVENLLVDCGFGVTVFTDYDIFNEDLKERYFFKAIKV